jgi:hypothetical protein
MKCPPLDLRRGFADPTDDTQLSQLQCLEWRTFAYDLTRHHVFGDRPYPITPSLSASQSPTGEVVTLLSLADAMERRQKQWHNLEPPSDEFPQRHSHHLAAGHAAGLTLEEIRKYEREGVPDNNHLCLQLVKHTKMCMKSLDKPVPRMGDCMN